MEPSLRHTSRSGAGQPIALRRLMMVIPPWHRQRRPRTPSVSCTRFCLLSSLPFNGAHATRTRYCYWSFSTAKNAKHSSRLLLPAEASYLETLMKAVVLGASASSSNQNVHRIVEAGLTLYALLHPWLPLSASTRETCAIEAALSLVTLALRQQEDLEDKESGGTTAKSSATSFGSLVEVVLVSLLRRQQSARLSVRCIALLGVIYSQLRNLRREKGWLPGGGGSERNVRSAPPADANALLWRILNALNAMSEKDAAEVRHVWMSGCEFDPVVRGSCIAECAPAGAPGNSALTSVRCTIRGGTETGRAKTAVCRGVHVIEALYHGALQALGEDANGHGATEQQSGRWKSPELLLGATRLRTWLTCESGVDAASTSRLALPQLCVLEEALCHMLKKNVNEEVGSARRGGSSSSRAGCEATSGGMPGPLAVRRDWRACLRMYTLYAELKRTCSAPLWSRQQRCLQSHAPKESRDSSRNDDVPTPHTCGSNSVGDVASLILELTLVAALSESEASSHSRHSGAISDAHQLALLSTFVRCCDVLGTPLPSLPCSQRLPRWGQERSSATPEMAQVVLPDASVLGHVGVDASAAVRHLATSLLSYLAEDASLSAPYTQAILHDWRVMLTPLQALRRVTSAFAAPGARLPEGGARADAGTSQGSVWLLSTSSAGLQWASACQTDPSSAKSAACLEVSRSDVDKNGCDAAQQTRTQPPPPLQPRSQQRRRDRDEPLQGFYYTTLRLLWRAGHLTKLPSSVLVKELLHPLAELERAAQPTASNCDGNAAEVKRKTTKRLAVLVDVAQQLSMHPMLKASATAASARGRNGHSVAGGTTALLVFKLLSEIEGSLRTRCRRVRHGLKGSESAALTNAPCLSPSRVFAIRYADLLAQRGTCAPDYLAFLLVVSHHCQELLPTCEGGTPDELKIHEERRRLLRHAQLRHAVAVTAPPSAVGAVMELFQFKHTTHGRGATAAEPRSCAPAAAESTSALASNTEKERQPADSEEDVNGDTDTLLGALTPDEEALLQRLHHLLQTSRGEACTAAEGVVGTK
ncbi:hypothetical protein, conserved [Leishmania tarentolae]|uniref:Uncharacterized protein n=1 Tax=Leishmania tarentolae TaxID=5689 RepID=A0A640K9V6_LEITA|nr:hypothetical protein, conserved [Leishmania tarentolae]